MKQLLIVCGALLALTACQEKDTTPPPKPFLDLLSSPTDRVKVQITGNAEYGSTVTVTGGKQEVTTTADAISSRFRAEVELNPDAPNALSITATDSVGNVSEAATMEVAHQTGFGWTVALAFAKPEVVAGEQVAIVARVLDGSGKEVSSAPLDFVVSPALEPMFQIPGSTPAVVRPQGLLPGTRQFVAYDLSRVAASGYEFTVTATSGKVTGTATLVVKPAQANGFSKLQLNPSGTSVTVPAGTDVSYSWQAVDLYGNVTSTPVSVVTDAPGAVVVDDGTSGSGKVIRLTTAGTYTLSFYPAGAGLKGTLQISVGAGPAALLELLSSTTLVSPNSDVKVFALVRDAYGNPIGCGTGTVADVAFAAQNSLGAAVAPTATQCSSFGSISAWQATYRFSAEDNYSIEAEYRPGGVASGVKRAVFVTVLSFDNTPPTVSVIGLRRNGTACPAAPAPCTVAPGDFVEFDVVANDNKALSEVGYSAFFSTAGGAGTLRSRQVFVPSNATLPVTQPFSFTVPGAFLEDVPLTARVVDGAGNIATSPLRILRISFQTFGGRIGTLVARDNGARVIDAPEDVTVAPNGDIYVGNTGGPGDLALIPGGTGTPVRYALTSGLPGGPTPGFMLRDAAGNLYFTDSGGARSLYRVDTASPPAGVDYLRYVNGANLRGLAAVAATAAKGIVNVPGAPADGDGITIGAVLYEVNTVDPCTAAAGKVCLNVPSPTGAALVTALSGCIGAGTGCTSFTPGGATVPARTDVIVTPLSTATVPALVIAAATAGAAGNALALSLAGTAICPNRLNLNNAGQCSPAVSTLTEGHDATVLVGQEAGGSSLIQRFPFTLTAPFPNSDATNEGTFDMAFGGQHQQWGLGARNLVTAQSRNLRDFAFYFPDATVGINRLRGVRFSDGGPGTAMFSSAAIPGRPACADCIRGTSDPATPIQSFGALWDVAVTANGCVLVSDEARGSIYVVDTRDTTNGDPLVSVVAGGLGSPRGIDLAPNGDLLVAVNGSNAIVRLSPTASTTDCF